MTYGELWDSSLRWAGALHKMNLNMEMTEYTHHKETVRIPPTIAVMTPNTLEFFPLFLGTIGGGFAFSPISAHYKTGTKGFDSR